MLVSSSIRGGPRVYSPRPSWVVQCPAKINTFLSVGRPDEKGWHPIRTVFHAVNLCDELHIWRSDKDFFETDVDWVPAENTVTKAWALLREAGFDRNLRVKLIKRIPAESGLGGGSSDAAGLIRFVKSVFGEFSETAEFWPNLALNVGADVPYFLVGGRAVGEGYGEQLTELPDEPYRHVLLVRPSVGCSTYEMYKALDSQRYRWRELPSGFEVYNDFEKVAPKRCIGLIRRVRDLGAGYAGLSGSGSCVFGFYPNLDSINNAAFRLRQEGETAVFTCRTLSRVESVKIS